MDLEVLVLNGKDCGLSEDIPLDLACYKKIKNIQIKTIK